MAKPRVSLPPEPADSVQRAALVMLHRLRRRIGKTLGITDETRTEALSSMLVKPTDDTATYWFQLMMSTGMATLGLVLGSVAVVIGAMLVAPLMTPIVELAMAQVVGASMLLLRALIRIVLSVAAVALASMFITLALPFNEPNPEILARTAPTVLDLCVAVFCALTAAFTTARTSSSAASTAAGTAIGISLVPPLCALGFGLGTADADIAAGALLLFTANFSAILLFAGLFFFAVGFRALSPDDMDESALAEGRIGQLAHRLSAVVDRGLKGPHNLMWRAGPPLLLFAAVSAPLTTALKQVSWQVKTRKALNTIVAGDPLLREAINITSTVDPGSLSVRAVIVGDEAAAKRTEEKVTAELAAAAGAVPRVVVRAVPPGNALEEIERAAARRGAAEPLATEQTVAQFMERLTAALGARWPQAVAGPIAAQRVVVGSGGRLEVGVTYWGPPLGDAAEHLLERVLTSDLGTPVDVALVELSRDEVTAALSNALAWYAAAAPLLAKALDVSAANVCLEMPDETSLRTQTTGQWVREQVEAGIADLDASRVTVTAARQWSVKLSETPCSSTR